MMRLVNVLFLLFSLMASLPVLAQDGSTEEGDVDVNDALVLEQVMTNTGNQFVYAFFGRDILTFYLSDSEHIEAVKEAREGELLALAEPFNATMGKLFMMGLTMIYGVTVGYLIMRFALFLSETGYLLQRDGQSPLSMQEKRGLWIKVVLLGGLAGIPIPLNNDLLEDTFFTNPATVFLFDLMGRAHETSDSSIEDLVESQRQTLRTLTLPAADSKISSGQALNSFYACVRTSNEREYNNRHSLVLPLYVTDGSKLQGQVTSGNCSLYVTLGVDVESDKKLEKMKQAAPEIGLDDNLFSRAQRTLFTSLLSELFQRGESVSEELVKTETSLDLDGGQFSFADHTSDVLNVRELEGWAARCNEVMSWSASGNGISRRDRIYYNWLTARCHSKLIAEKLVYPKSYEAMSNYLGNAGRSQQELALCVDQSAMSETLGNSRFVAEYGIGSGTSRSSNIEQIALDGCLADLCSDSNLQDGGIYACTNAMDLYQTRLKDVRLQQRGTLMLGFYMFDLFVHHPPSSSAKRIFNTFDISFSMGEGAESDPPGEPFLTVGVPIPGVDGATLKQGPVLDDLSRDLEANELPTIFAPLPESDSLINEIFGYTRLEACAKNPLQIHAGYVCGNVPQEFSRFGMTLLKSAVTLKTALIMGQTTGMLKKATVNESGQVSGFKQMNGLTRFIRTSGGTIMSFVGGDGGPYERMFDSVFDLEWQVTDEFGYLNTTTMNSLLRTVPAALVAAMAHLGADTAMISVVDFVLMTVMLLGVVFAFLMPLFPMILVLNALIKFFYLLLVTLMMHGFKLVDAAFDKDFDILNESLDKVFADWLALILKLPLTVIGVVLAWLMSNVILSHVLGTMSLMVPTNDGFQEVLDMLVTLVASGVIIFIIYNTVLTIIESFYDFTVEWILGSMHNNPFMSDSKAFGWKDARDVLHLMGR